MVKYKVLFFDLDHTLWDYDTNSIEVLSEIYHKHVSSDAVGLELFLKNFTKVNDALWDEYNRGKIEKEVIRKDRFVKILEQSDVYDLPLAQHISEFYLFECPRRTHLMPDTIEVLTYLKDKYELHILTNGFDDVQEIKLNNAGIKKYFDKVITSESIGHKKPSKEFFEYAFSATNSENREAIMIGDNLKTDIAGANNVGMDSVYFNPSGYAKPHKAKFEIKKLSELMDVL
ncbi:MAG: YjjG family noncanonical pyrimidine nucleotidase [Cyclobacteriaceae bacterium]|nr:YjjG family noncanonical pyrimidine nucleotidase [Cyclobacteriaceae bacterium]